MSSPTMNPNAVGSPSTPPPPSHLSSSQSTPLSGKHANRGISSASAGKQGGPTNLPVYRQSLGREMKELIVQISLDDFLAKFVPGNDPTAEERARFVRYDKNVFDVAAENPKMYTEFCKATISALQASSDQRGDLIASDTGSHTDSADKANRYRPDVSIFPTFDAAKKAYTLELKDTPATSGAQDRPYLARTSWSYVLIPVEVKAGADGSAFLWDDKGGFLRDGDGGLEALGQLVHYAFLTFRYQHRTSLFMVVTCRHRARIIRWDRSAAVVTRPFEFAGDSNALLDFFYKFSKLSDAQRGLDTTAVLATKNEEDTLKQSEHLIPEAQRDLYKEITGHGRPIYKITIPASDIISPAQLRPTDPTSEQSECSASPSGSSTAPVADPVAETQQARTFFIGEPRFTSDSATGRSTRGYVAYDMLKRRIVFLKDSWRSGNGHAEHKIYLDLWKHNVPHIATPLSGGDVCDDSVQTTRSQECDVGLQKRIHYRLIVLEVGRPLKDYEEAVYLVQFIQQAVEAHRGAYTKARIMHRDVSADNIVFDSNPPKDGEGHKLHRAFLIDWDLCKYIAELESGPTQATRSGTWQFMSAALLRYPSKRQGLSDDLESFIYIIYWLALRFHDHNLFEVELEDYIHSAFDQRWNYNGRDVGGRTKLDLMKSGSPPCQLIDDPAFNWLLQQLASMCQDHYSAAAPELSGFDAAELERKKQNVGKKKLSTAAKYIRKSNPPDTGKDAPRPGKSEEALPKRDPFSGHQDLITLLDAALDREDWVEGKTEDQFASFGYYCRSQHQRSTRSKRGSEATAAPTKTKRSRVSDSH